MKKHVYLTGDDVHSLANVYLTEDNHNIIYVLAFCGLRWGELIAPKVKDVELLRRRHQHYR